MTARPERRGRADDPYARVIDVLGERSMHIGSPIELHEWIAEGLPRVLAVNLVSNLHDIKFDESLRALNMSSRTWHRFKASPSELNKRLDVDQSARVWSLAEILAKAQEVLGSREEAEHWLSRPAIGLDSRRPIDLMATPQGTDLVRTLLQQMEHGVYA